MNGINGLQMSIPRLARYKARFDMLHNREVMALPNIDWNWIASVGLITKINPYLTRVYMGKGFSFTYAGWMHLFKIQEPLYKELCVEFLSTISFNFQEDMKDTKALSFRLGGVDRQYSLETQPL